MKIEASKLELVEAWTLGTVGAIEGAYKYYLKPLVEDQPILAYMLSGAIGGIAVNRLLSKED